MASSGESPRFSLSRRAFLQAAVAAGAAGAAAALPLSRAATGVSSLVGSLAASGATLAPLPGGPFFLDRSYTPSGSTTAYDLWATAAAVCAQMVPSDAFGPGANEAGAVNYIDMFMSAFDPGLLSSGLVDTNPVFLHGRFSGRWPFGNEMGGPGAAAPDNFETLSGNQVKVLHFLGLSPAQAVAWYARIYGEPTQAPAWMSFMSSTWASQVTSTAGPTGSPPTIPGAQNLRQLYLQGLPAFDQWSEQNFGTTFASADPLEQEVMVLLATNPAVDAASSNGLPELPSPLPSPIPPAAVTALAPVMVLHAIQGSYGLPEYAGRSDEVEGGQVTWASIGWDGDTQPLGNSIYDESLNQNSPAEPENVYTNTGFGFPPGTTSPPGAYTPVGAYVEYRPVSYPAPGSDLTQEAISAFETLIQALEAAGFTVTQFGG